MNEYLSDLNNEQKEAVNHVDGPLLVLAGAGTGKTRVLTSRIINLIQQSHALPSQIMAVTFTNKAAGEIKNRITSYIGDASIAMNIGTFHSISARILRKHSDMLKDYTRNYTIVNNSDQLKIVKDLIRELGEKELSAKLVLYLINKLKDKAIYPQDKEYIKAISNIEILDRIYEDYQRFLRKSNAMDFGDLILNTLSLFNSENELCEYYKNRYKYVLVDEYQDTNVAQYLLIRMLAQNNNLCCVGDDDQSIYGWRGAEVTNILQFDKDYPGAKIVKLEENYRSTQKILTLAGALIAKNKNRHFKGLWSSKNGGDDVEIANYYDDKEEARSIAKAIDFFQKKNIALSNIAILVRAGYQTRNFEDSLNLLGIPYRIVGSVRFYDRSEIKDCLAYIRLIVNGDDNIAFERIINTPKRAIGNSSMKKIINYSQENNKSYFASVEDLLLMEKTFQGKAAKNLKNFFDHIKLARENIYQFTIDKVIENFFNDIGYIDMLKNDSKNESFERIANIKELLNGLNEYANLEDFLNYVSLVNDVDNFAEDNKVSIMTIHAAKGLEFDTVFLPGWEEGIFPSAKSIEEDNGIEEERRLAYVAITRAKERLRISYATYRRVFGDFQFSDPSRFISEFPDLSYKVVNTHSLKRKTGKVLSGDRVTHFKFGRGVVLGGDDVKEVFFEKIGVKKILVEFLKHE